MISITPGVNLPTPPLPNTKPAPPSLETTMAVAAWNSQAAIGLTKDQVIAVLNAHPEIIAWGIVSLQGFIELPE